MWAGLQDRIDDCFTPLFDAEKNRKNLYELFIDRATILFSKIIFDIFHDPPFKKSMISKLYFYKIIKYIFLSQ